MNTIAWAIIVFNMHYGTSHHMNQVRWATKEQCEEALTVMEPVTSLSKTLKYRCMQVVVPAVGIK